MGRLPVPWGQAGDPPGIHGLLEPGLEHWCGPEMEMDPCSLCPQISEWYDMGTSVNSVPPSGMSCEGSLSDFMSLASHGDGHVLVRRTRKLHSDYLTVITLWNRLPKPARDQSSSSFSQEDLSFFDLREAFLPLSCSVGCYVKTAQQNKELLSSFSPIVFLHH